MTAFHSPVRWIQLTLCLLVLTFAPASHAIQAELRGNSIIASDVDPGAQVVIYGIALTAGEGGIRRLVEVREVAVDDDQDGAVEQPLDFGLPLHAVFTAVDVTSGEYGITRPAGSGAVEIDFPGRGSLGELRRLRHEGLGFVHLLVVRPGEGAWALTASDGGPFDADGSFHDGVLLALDLVEGLEGFEDVALPEAFRPGDTVVVIDSDTLRYYSTQLPGGGS
jgi:hypothetical protein